MEKRFGVVSADGHCRLMHLPFDLWTKRLPQKVPGRRAAGRAGAGRHPAVGRRGTPLERRRAGPASAGGRSIAIRGPAWRRSRSPASSAPPMPDTAAKTWTATASTPSSSTAPTSRSRRSRTRSCAPPACAPSTTGRASCTRSRTAGSSCCCRCRARRPRRRSAELLRVAEFGLPTGVIFDWVNAPEPVLHQMWEPVWAAAAETGLPVNLHANPSGGSRQIGVGVARPGTAQPVADAGRQLPDGAMAELMSAVVFSGICDRHPGVRFVLEEAGVGWVPFLFWRFDREYDFGGPDSRVFKPDIPLSEKPTEFVKRQVFFTFEVEEEGGFRRVPEIGLRELPVGQRLPRSRQPVAALQGDGTCSGGGGSRERGAPPTGLRQRGEPVQDSGHTAARACAHLMRRRWCARDGCEELQVAVNPRQISAHVQSGNTTDGRTPGRDV